MMPSNRQELVEELNATDSRYIKKKLKLGGYGGWMKPVVEHFLDEKQAAITRAKDVLYWVGGIISVGAAAAGVLRLWA